MDVHHSFVLVKQNISPNNSIIIDLMGIYIINLPQKPSPGRRHNFPLSYSTLHLRLYLKQQVPLTSVHLGHLGRVHIDYHPFVIGREGLACVILEVIRSFHSILLFEGLHGLFQLYLSISQDGDLFQLSLEGIVVSLILGLCLQGYEIPIQLHMFSRSHHPLCSFSLSTCSILLAFFLYSTQRHSDNLIRSLDYCTLLRPHLRCSYRLLPPFLQCIHMMLVGSSLGWLREHLMMFLGVFWLLMVICNYFDFPHIIEIFCLQFRLSIGLYAFLGKTQLSVLEQVLEDMVGDVGCECGVMGLGCCIFFHKVQQNDELKYQINL